MTPAEARGHQASVHLAIEDSSGDSAIIEYISGKPVIHHGREFRIMANDPVYDEQLAAGLFEAEQRFADSRECQRRRAFPAGRLFKAMLPEPKNEREAVAGVLAIARNVSVPFGAPYEDFGIYNSIGQ